MQINIHIFVTCFLIILEKAAVRPAVLIVVFLRYRSIMTNVHASGVSLTLSGISYNLAAVMHVNSVNLCTIKPQL